MSARQGAVRWSGAVLATMVVVAVAPSAQRAGGGAPAPAPAQAAPATPVRFDIAAGSTAQYRVKEEFVGVGFPNDAVGTTPDITGALVFKADGTIDAAQSKITVDLRTLKSDSDRRDNFIRSERVLNTAKSPTAEFVPKRATGLPWPLGAGTQPQFAGFQLIGDMTIAGTTREVTWKVVANLEAQRMQGRATTEITFAQFNLPKPMLARLLSVGDAIQVELDLRLTRQAL